MQTDRQDGIIPAGVLRKVFNGFVVFCAVAGVVLAGLYVLTGANYIGQPRSPVSAKDFGETVLFVCTPMVVVCGRVLKLW